MAGCMCCISQAATSCLHIPFHKSILFIIALLFSHTLVEKGVIQILVVYLANYVAADVHLLVILSNLQEALSGAMSLIMVPVMEKWTDPFKMIVISTIAYASGMWLLYFSTKVDSNVILLFSLAMLPTAIGIGGRDSALYDFIREQIIQSEKPNSQQNESRREDRVENRKEFWVRISRTLGSIAAFLWFGKQDWGNYFKFSAILILVSGFIFACGHPFYNYPEPSGSAFGGLFRVIIAAIKKRDQPYPLSPAQFYEYEKNESVLGPRDSQSRCWRWVDKAAVVMPTRSPQEQEREKQLFPMAKVEEAKRLLALTPLWASLFIFSLVVAAGSTFFYLQSKLMNNKVGVFHIPVTYFTVTLSFSSGIATLVFGTIINCLWRLRSSTERPWKLKIGLALFCFFLSCIAAWLVETHRHHMFAKKGKVDISVLWLTPQFWLWGFTQGFSDDGLKDFYDNQATGNRHPFLKWAFSSGTFFSIVWILAFQSWFHKTINESRLKAYFVVVAILCFVNLIFFYIWTCNLAIFGCDSIAIAEKQVELENPASLPSNPVRPSMQSSSEGVTECNSST